MQPTHPNDYLWQEIASYQQYAHTQFDAAVQALTLYLQVWLVLAAAFSVLALGLVLFRAWRRRWAQKHEKITATRPARPTKRLWKVKAQPTLAWHRLPCMSGTDRRVS